jgi:hypothetical protein
VEDILASVEQRLQDINNELNQEIYGRQLVLEAATLSLDTQMKRLDKSLLDKSLRGSNINTRHTDEETCQEELHLMVKADADIDTTRTIVEIRQHGLEAKIGVGYFVIRLYTTHVKCIITLLLLMS